MDKKREKIIKFLEKASVYASKSQDSLNEALKVALYGKGLTKKKCLFCLLVMRQEKKKSLSVSMTVSLMMNLLANTIVIYVIKVYSKSTI